MLRKLAAPIVLLLCILCFNVSLHAQANTNAANKLYQKAMVAFENYHFEEGVKFLQTSIEKDNHYLDSYIALFEYFIDHKKNREAIQIFESGYIKEPSYFNNLFVKYATAYASIGNYPKALSLLKSQYEALPSNLKSKAAELMSICDFAMQQVIDPNIQVINAGDSINTAAPEYFPAVTVQDSLFLFMRRDGITREDFYYSTITPTGFSNAIPLMDSINNSDKKGAPSLSSDLKTLFFAAELQEYGMGRYDIYTVVKTPTGWSEPMNVGPNINTTYWESAPSISPDGQALYFCSNKPGGYGGIDIYVAYLDEEGSWGEAMNLGPNINTKGDEQTPFIHADNHSLYFSSNGWPGFGNADLFVARKKIDGSWTKPMNLGYPINSYDNEGSVAISSNGTEGYIASDRPDSRGGLDIYKINLAENTKANKTYYLNGHIVEAGTKKSLPGNVKLADLTDSTQFMQIYVDNAGYFVLALPYFDTLALQISSPQHEYASSLMTADSIKAFNGKTIEFELAPIQKVFTKNFENVFFNINSAQLQSRSNNELNALVAYLKNNPTATILIEGHTDNTGSDRLNETLSSKRAEAIAAYLIQKGIDPHLIYTKGYGARKPIADNSTEAGRAQNRRTSFTITLP